MKFNWGHGILVFFTIFLSLAIFFIVFSFRHKNDLVTKDYYEKGANYSKQMVIDQRSFPYKDSLTIKRTGEALKFNFTQSLIQNVDTLSIHFFRPSDKKLDYHTKLAIDSTSIFFDKSVLAHGRYEVKMSWEMNGDAYYLKKDVQIK